LRNSSFSRKRRAHGRAATALAAVAWSCGIAAIGAIDPERTPSQYIRDRWDSSNGFQGGPVYAISQTVDGYLWVAAERGLVRFDGLTFRLFQPMESASGLDSVAVQIAPASDGPLWARLRRADLVRSRNGAYEHIPSDPGSPMLLTTAMAPANDGTMLVADERRGIFRARAARFDTIVAKSLLPRSFVISIAQTPDGDMWLGTRDAGLVRVREGQVAFVTDGLPDQKINSLVADGRDQLWIGTDNGVVRWDGQRVTHSHVPSALDRVRATAMMKDRDANVWIGTADGLLRVNGRGLASHDRRMPGAGVTALFEDRDGNLWIGTTTGIERWRDGAFTAYPEVRTVTMGGDAGPVFVDTDGRVWFAPSTGGLYWLRDGRVSRVTEAGLRDDVIYSIDGNGNDLWIGRQRGGLTHLQASGDAFTTETYTQARGLAQNYVYAVLCAGDGAVWAGTLSGGVSRLKNGAFTNHTAATGLASNTIASVLQAADGTVWFATPNGASALSASGWRRYSTADGLPSNDVNTLFEDSAHDIWIGTNAGLAVVRNGRLQSGLPLPESLRTSIVGIAEDMTGSLWTASADRVLRVDREGLLDGSLGDDGVREFGAADGLIGIEGVKRDRSLRTDPNGRIWVSTNGGLAMVDPVRLAGRSGPALVHVEGVSADGTSVNVERGATIEPRRQRITLAFTGLSLSIPERVRFRYRLDGFDRDWSEPVSARQAVYTNLGPGAYRFRVIASNSDGVWNSAEAAWSFTIRPAFWETVWFRGSVLLLISGAVWAADRLRVIRISRQLNLRFEDRLAERTRIARELHDTLLQSFQGVLMQFQAVTHLIPHRAAEAQRTLETGIEQARQAITEGRDAVQGLRSSTAVTDDIAGTLTALGEALASKVEANRPDFSVSVEGRPRALAPLLGGEVYGIAREALRNAFWHGHATQIEVEIRYDRSEFRLRVRDNGKGIDPSVLDRGRAGHFGLTGMQERAGLLGGTLSVWSELDSGTETELTIPAFVAYSKSPVQRASTVSRSRA